MCSAPRGQSRPRASSQQGRKPQPRVARRPRPRTAVFPVRPLAPTPSLHLCHMKLLSCFQSVQWKKKMLSSMRANASTLIYIVLDWETL